MDKMSHKASKFIAVAHYLEHADQHGNPANAYTKAFAFEPSNTIEDIFKAIWPEDVLVHYFERPPVKIEIMPDHNSIPVEPRTEFDDILEGK